MFLLLDWLTGWLRWKYTIDWKLLLLLLSRFSHVWLCETPLMAAHQAPPSLGFSRQEHWRGLPFPSPMHESEKWKWKVKVKLLSCVWFFVTSWTIAYQAPLSLGFSKQEYWSGLPLPSPDWKLHVNNSCSKHHEIKKLKVNEQKWSYLTKEKM